MAVISYFDVLSDSVSLSSFIEADISITALLLLLILMTETINAFFNPVEAAVFALLIVSVIGWPYWYAESFDMPGTAEAQTIPA